MNTEDFSLNNNLEIPFSNSKVFPLDVARLQREYDYCLAAGDNMNDKIELEVGENFEISVAGRGSGKMKLFFWRYKSDKKDRKYKRLQDEIFREYLDSLTEPNRKALRHYELELIAINSNIKAVMGKLDGLKYYLEEEDLHYSY